MPLLHLNVLNWGASQCVKGMGEMIYRQLLPQAALAMTWAWVKSWGRITCFMKKQNGAGILSSKQNFSKAKNHQQVSNQLLWLYCPFPEGGLSSHFAYISILKWSKVFPALPSCISSCTCRREDIFTQCTLLVWFSSDCSPHPHSQIPIHEAVICECAMAVSNIHTSA